MAQVRRKFFKGLSYADRVYGPPSKAGMATGSETGMPHASHAIAPQAWPLGVRLGGHMRGGESGILSPATGTGSVSGPHRGNNLKQRSGR
jgi:hypothetical protein